MVAATVEKDRRVTATIEEKVNFQARRKAERKLDEQQLAALERLEAGGWKFTTKDSFVWAALKLGDWEGNFDSLESAIAGAERYQQTSPTIIRESYRQLDLDQIVASPFQMRKNFDEASLAELAESIRSKGVLEPILVRPIRSILADNQTQQKIVDALGLAEFELVAGERRFRAAKLAGLETIPAIIRQLSDRESAEIGAIENLQRKDLASIEEAEGFRILIENHGYTADSLAEKLHKSKSYIYGMLKLCGLPEVARQKLSSGELPISTAQLIARIPNEKLRAKAAEEIAAPQWSSEPLSFRQAKQRIEGSYMKELKGMIFKLDDADLLPTAGACTTCPKLTGNNRTEFPDGRADICTDPGCLSQKISAYDKAEAERIAAKGYKVLSKSDAKKVFDWNNHVQPSSGYVLPSAKCDSDANGRTYKQLAGKDAVQYVAIDSKRKPHYLLKLSDIAPALKEEGIKVSTPKPSRSSQYDYEAERLKHEKVEAIANRAMNKIAEEIVRTVEGGSLVTESLRWFAVQFLRYAGGIGDTAKRRGFADSDKGIAAYVSDMQPWQVMGLILEVEARGAIDYYGKLEDHGTGLMEIFGVNWKERHKAAADAIAAEEKAAEPAADAAKPAKKTKKGAAAA
jgi:ParB/RepB/Spo0J family partition protein